MDAAADHFDMLLSSICSGKTMELCESPIEEAMLEAITLFHCISYSCLPQIHGREVCGGNSWIVEQQAKIADYRVDFLITFQGCKTQLVVECDGHDFHEKTKEQAKRGKSRDRDLTALGYVVIHFTGSEIWRDPWRCAEEIERQFHSIQIREVEAT